MPLHATVTIVVDRDYDGVPFSCAWLCLTDGHSMESYAMRASALERFVRVTLGRADHLHPGPDRRLTSGSDLRARVLDAALDVASVRLALESLDEPTGLIAHWLDYVTVTPDGRASGRPQELLRACLLAGASHDRQALEQLRTEERERVASDTFRLAHGRDLVEILAKLLRGSWARALAGVYSRAKPRELARALIGCHDASDLDAQPMFATLRGRYTESPGAAANRVAHVPADA